MSRKIIVGIGVVLGGLVLVLSVGLAYERGHNGGYNDGWNDGRADGWDEGYNKGWRGCIEENNLYERYYYEKYCEWRRGECYIQDIPLNVCEREFLKTGLCRKCQKMIFNNNATTRIVAER